MPRELSFCSSFRQDECTIKWTIEKFECIPFYDGNIIKTPVFTIGTDVVTSWQIVLQFYIYGGNYIGIFLKAHGKEVHTFINCEIAIKDQYNVSHIARKMPQHYIQSLYKCGGAFDYEVMKRDSWIKDFLVLLCKVTVISFKDELEGAASSDCIPPFLHDYKSLSHDLKGLYFDRKTCDFTLKVEEKEIHVHKTLLTARSPVFAAMLQHDTAENKSNTAVIKDVSSTAMTAMVHYMYTGVLAGDATMDAIAQLYSAANRYQVDSLAKSCSQYLADHLDADNACYVYQIAHLHKDQQLKKATKQFIMENSSSVLKSEGWKSILEANAALAAEILTFVAEKHSAE